MSRTFTIRPAKRDDLAGVTELLDGRHLVENEKVTVTRATDRAFLA